MQNYVLYHLIKANMIRYKVGKKKVKRKFKFAFPLRGNKRGDGRSKNSCFFRGGVKMAEEQDGKITFSSTNSLKEQQNGEQSLQNNF